MKPEAQKTRHGENLTRLSRIEGQVRGVRRMVEEGEYCIDILTQIQAVQSALGAVGRRILQKHLDTCVREAFQGASSTEPDDKIRELMRVMKRMGR